METHVLFATEEILPDELPTQTVAGYEILGELGRGGMGVVYKARQQGLGRLVALKMILAGGHANAARRQRFLTEAEAVARLQHPHIVQIHEIGEHEGRPFFSLEYCPGGGLDKKLRGTPLPPREAAQIVEILAEAMEVAHQAGVVHRDLKPANILLTADGQPKITDFGLAKKLDDPTGQTRSRDIMGTPSYMAPEQAQGKGAGIGPTADVYALGAILYELLTGRAPFKAATAWDTLMQVVHSEPVPPRQLQPRAPRDLETICLKCLQKDPRKRYASARALAEDLRRFRNDEPIRARPVSAAERLVRWCRRHPGISTLAAALVVVVAASLAGLSALYLRSEGQRRRAEDERQQARYQQHRAEEEAEHARDQEERAKGLAAEARQRQQEAEAQKRGVEEVSTFLVAMFKSSDPLGLQGFTFFTPGTNADQLTARMILDRGAAELSGRLQDQPGVRAALLETIGHVYRTLGLFKEAEPRLQQALELRRGLGERTPEYATAAHNLGWLYHDLGRYGEAEKLYRRALALRQDLLGEEHPAAQASKFNLAWLLTQRGDFVEAEKLFQEVLAARRHQLGGDEHRQVALVKAALAALYLNRGQPEKAWPLSLEAVQVLRKQESDRRLAQAVGLFQEGVVAKNLLGAHARAARLLRQALDVTARSPLGIKHPYTALILHELADALEHDKQDARAEQYYRQCLDVVRATVGLGHPLASVAVCSLARLLARTQRLPEANRLFEELLSAQRQRFGVDSPLVADAMVQCAGVLGGCGAPTEAKRLLTEALKIYRWNGDAPTGMRTMCLYNLALLHCSRGKYADAEELLNEALPLARRQFGAKHRNIAMVLANLASARLRQKETAGVAEMLAEALAIQEAAWGDRSPAKRAIFRDQSLLCRLSGRPAEAVEAALKLRDLRPTDPEVLYDAARELALCVTAVSRGQTVLTEKGGTERQQYADLAVATLRQAVARGYKKGGQVAQEKAFAALRDREDFKKLVQELTARP